MNTFGTAKYGTLDRDVTYCTIDGRDLTMDVYYPGSGGPWPCLLWVHGGAWSEGDKAPVPVNLVGAGYLVASINYRMFPAYRFPAMIEDVKCAIRYMRAHAAAYNLNPDRIALAGHSAGGHLVALAGLADEGAGWDVGPYLDQSSRVQAVIDLSGPTDLTQRFPDDVEDLKDAVFGRASLASGSPVTYVHRGGPPFMIVHGEADEIVPVEQARLFHAALAAAGVPVEKVILENAGHGFEPVGGTVSPPLEHAFEAMLVFLSKMG